MSDIQFCHDPNMDSMITDIIDIFKMEGVELVRLSGLTTRERAISTHHDMPARVVDGIVRKLRGANVIRYAAIIYCPHCGETSYLITGISEGQTIGPKLCDSCSTFYQPLLGSTFEWCN